MVLEFAAFDETGTVEGLLRSERSARRAARRGLPYRAAAGCAGRDAARAVDEKTIEGFRKSTVRGRPPSWWAGDLSATPLPDFRFNDGTVMFMESALACRVRTETQSLSCPSDITLWVVLLYVSFCDPLSWASRALQDGPVRLDVSFLAVE